MMWATATSPSGYLLCDGTAVSRTTYSSLWDVLRAGGSTSPYGSGDGSTTFNLPNLVERVPVGSEPPTSLGTATITIAAPGVVTLTAHGLATGQIVYFTTTGALPTGLVATTGRYWVISLTANTFNLATSLANAIAGTTITTSGTQSGTHTLFSADFELGRSNGLVNHKLSETEIPSHLHSVDPPSTTSGNNSVDHTHSWTYNDAVSNSGDGGSSGKRWDNSNDTAEGAVTVATGSNSADHTHAVNIAAFDSALTGGGLAHTNLQPYIVLNYIIKT